MKPSSYFLFSIFLVFSFLFLVPLVSAQEVEQTFPFQKQLDFKRPCFNNGTFCSGSAVCNITMIRPDGSLMVNNQEMTNQQSFHNVTVLQENVSQLGVHQVILTCNDPGGDIIGKGDRTLFIDITGDGFSFRTFPYQFVILIFSFIFIAAGSLDDRLRLFKYSGAIVTMVMGVLFLYPGFGNINFSTLMGKGIGFTSIGLGFFFLINDAFSFDKQVPHFDQHDDGRFHG